LLTQFLGPLWNLAVMTHNFNLSWLAVIITRFNFIL
jgi:hypothetical protein